MDHTTVVGSGIGLALGPQAVSPTLGWLLQWAHDGSMPIPTEAVLTSASTIVVFFGGGLVWLTVTLVRWALAKRGIIKEEPTNA